MPGSPLRIALTSGEPAGIGPDLMVQLAQLGHIHELVVLADPNLLEERARQLNLPLSLLPYKPDNSPAATAPGTLSVLPVPLAATAVAGELNPANASYVLATLDRACKGCEQGEFAAMVTAPVQKSVINDAGVPFSGHTEYLAALTGTPRVVMLLACEAMRVALATTHLPLAQVAENINAADLRAVLEILHADLQAKFAREDPQIAVLGLNPHAGEAGHLGREEIEIIEPTLHQLRAEGMRLLGPLPADTAFNPAVLDNCDAVLAMYHDQGLPVLKYAGFGDAVNITLGLPIIRTSVDHGTALDLAGRGGAKPGSLLAAVSYASELAENALR